MSFFEDRLDSDISYCGWFDCLGRQVKIRTLAFEKILLLSTDNIQEHSGNNHNNMTDDIYFMIQINTLNQDMIKVHQSYENNLSEAEVSWLDVIREKFIYEDESEILPIPVLSTTSPRNTLQFLIHIILSMDNYTTEIDA